MITTLVWEKPFKIILSSYPYLPTNLLIYSPDTPLFSSFLPLLLKQLQYFVVSVESGSFKKAADILYTTQPHISKSIKALETELDVQILERKARGVEEAVRQRAWTMIL